MIIAYELGYFENYLIGGIEVSNVIPIELMLLPDLPYEPCHYLAIVVDRFPNQSEEENLIENSFFFFYFG